MPPGNRPKEIHTKHLTEIQRFRVRTLYYDACMSKKRIEEITGYSRSQIRTAIRAKSAAVPPRSGRPKKVRDAQPADSQTDEAGPSSEGLASDDSGTAQSSSPGNPIAALLSASASSPAPAPREAARPRESSLFHALPAELRRHIWRLALISVFPPPPPSPSPSRSDPSRSLTSSAALPPSLYPPPSSCSPLSCTWWLEKLPQPPWLVAGVFPEHWNTHWPAYLAHRQAAARQLSQVSREARQVVVDTLAPVASEAGLLMLGSAVRFLWLDPQHDQIYYKDDIATLPAQLDKARAAVLPHLPRSSTRTSAASGPAGSNSHRDSIRV